MSRYNINYEHLFYDDPPMHSFARNEETPSYSHSWRNEAPSMRERLHNYFQANEYQMPNYFQPYMEPSYPQPHSTHFPTLYTHPYEPPYTPYHNPSPSTYYTPSPPPSPPQPSGLDAFLTLPNMDSQTLVLRREYDELKGQHSQLFKLKMADKLTEEMEERLEEIEEFIRAFVQHVLWKKTNGEEGTPWPCESNDCEGVEDQEPNATSQVDDPQQLPIPTQATNEKQAHSQLPEELASHLGNISPLLEEVTSPHATFVGILSDDEVDEEIVVESPHILIGNAQCSTSNSSCVVDDVACITSMCGEHDASLSASCDDCFDLHKHSPCSCDYDTMCMDCIDLKYDRFVALHKKNFGEVHDISTSANDASSLGVNIVENCEQLPSFSSVDKHDDLSLFESIEHDEAISSSSIDNMTHATLDNGHETCTSYDPNVFLSLGRSIRKDSHVLNDEIVKENESFHQILSCDLPPDLDLHCMLHQSSSSSTLLPSTSCDCKCDVVYLNTKSSSSPFRLQPQEDFTNKMVSLTPTDGSVDFLGCESYLGSLDIKLLKSNSMSLQVCLFGFGTAAGLISSQGHFWRRQRWYTFPPPPRKINKGEVCALMSNIHLIMDENFSFKCLKIP